MPRRGYWPSSAVTSESTTLRPYDVSGGYATAPWHYAFSHHREFDGVRIPKVAVATYEKEGWDWEYLHIEFESVAQEMAQG